MPGVTFEHVTKRFDRVVALNDLNLEVKDKEFLVLVGPSGCGKTTALRCLAGLEEATSGIIKIGPRVVNDVAPKDRDIAMVFQSYALYPHMTVYDNMAFGLKLRRVPRPEIDRRVKEAAEVLGLTDMLKRQPRQLSGGQRQRVALGRAIVREPQVFLLDEPLSNLDAKLRVQTRADISKLHQRLQTTFVYVTHDQTEAMTMATRIAVMRDGILQQLDTPQVLYDKPTNVFVAGFIGSPSMNFFDAKITKSDFDPVRRCRRVRRTGALRQIAALRFARQQGSHLRHPPRAHSRPAVRPARNHRRACGNPRGRDRTDGQRSLPVPGLGRAHLHRPRRPAHPRPHGRPARSLVRHEPDPHLRPGYPGRGPLIRSVPKTPSRAMLFGAGFFCRFEWRPLWRILN